MRELADRVGLSYGTVRVYRAQGLAPEPDEVIDGKPFWTPASARRWKEQRAKAAATQTD